MSLEIRLLTGQPSGERLAVEVHLRCPGRVQVDVLAVVGLCARGLEMGPKVLVPLPGILAGERCLEVRLCIAQAAPVQIRCTAWVEGVEEPVVVIAPVRGAYPGLTPELVACLDEIQVDHCETSFGHFLEDFCQMVDAEAEACSDVEDIMRQFMFGEE